MPESAIRRVVVLAAGRGTRMGEITADIPKPMLPVRGRPILEHVLDRLAAAGAKEFFIVVGHRRELIEAYFRNWRFPIQFLVQDPVNGTGSAALLSRDFVAGAPFLLTFADILCDSSAYLRCARVLEEHPTAAAVLGVREVDDPWRWAAVYVEAGKVTNVIEKPPRGGSTTHWNSAGLFVFRPPAFEYLARLQPSVRNEYELTAIFNPMLRDNLELRISAIEGNWRDVGYPDDLEAVKADQ